MNPAMKGFVDDSELKSVSEEDGESHFLVEPHWLLSIPIVNDGQMNNGIVK